MSLTAPKLDDRRFADLVEEAIDRIPHYCKEWTDHNDSDPGVTLIELFAWMTDMLLYRLNQVPDLHYIRFLQMLGIHLEESVAAQVPVTFWLSEPQPTHVIIPAGTEVASTQTEIESSTVFTTMADFTILLPQLKLVLRDARKENHRYQPVSIRRLEAGFEGVDMFSAEPGVDDAFYFGFENDLSHHLLGLDAEVDLAAGAGVKPSEPPYVWEASTGDAVQPWMPCDPDLDTTLALNTSGQIRIHLPKMGKLSLEDYAAYWVRIRLRDTRGKRTYNKPPRLRKCLVASWGATIPAIHARHILREFLGRSDGSPGQRFRLQNTPVLKRDSQAGEHLTVQTEGKAPEAWIEVEDFSGSHASDKHFTLDGVSGELRLGPAVKQQEDTIRLYGDIPRKGTIRLYGDIPPKGSNLIFERYRYGGGQAGNVQERVLNTLKTSIPYVDKVMNRTKASDGRDHETLESAKQRAPAVLHSRDRAITEADFEFLARQALPARRIGRVKCLQALGSDKATPGQVYVVVIPRLAHPENRLDPKELDLKPEDMATLRAYLDERRLLTTRLEITKPAYRWVAVRVKLQTVSDAVKPRVEAEVLRRLYAYLNPLTGGPNQEGWPFGRDLFLPDLYPCLQGLPDVLFIDSVEMYIAKETGEAQEKNPVPRIDLVRHGMIASGRHRVEFLSG